VKLPARASTVPIAHEGGSAVLRPCVGIATLPEHGFDPAQLLMAADIARHIAATREENYHVYQGFEAVEDEVYRGLDLDLERAMRANELELWYQPQVDVASGARSPSKHWCAGAMRAPATFRPPR
jgi:predicted signal transduction protein with EAL and GGDEF domain